MIGFREGNCFKIKSVMFRQTLESLKCAFAFRDINLVQI